MIDARGARRSKDGNSVSRITPPGTQESYCVKHATITYRGVDSLHREWHHLCEAVTWFFASGILEVSA